MSRYGESSGPVPNPCDYYLEWNSALNSFSYWKKGEDQEQGQRIPYPMPFRFAMLKSVFSISGYDENRRQGLYSNEVVDTRTEPFRVFYRDNSPCAHGIYSQIKDHVKSRGGHFVRSIYAMTPLGTIVNIKIKGGQMINFGVIEKFGLRFEDEWIEVSSFEEKQDKEGKPYSLPLFEFNGSFTPRDIEFTDKAIRIVKHYFNSKAPVHATTAPGSSVASAKMPTPAQQAYMDWEQIGDDDLPF